MHEYYCKTCIFFYYPKRMNGARAYARLARITRVVHVSSSPSLVHTAAFFDKFPPPALVDKLVLTA